MKEKIDTVLPDLKAEMVKIRSWAVSSKADLKKQYGSTQLNDAITRNERIKNIYSISKTLPISIDGIVVNYVPLSRLLKKLNGFNVSFEINNNSLIVKYEKSKNKGKMVLNDISRYFKQFNHVPVLTLSDLQN